MIHRQATFEARNPLVGVKSRRKRLHLHFPRKRRTTRQRTLPRALLTNRDGDGITSFNLISMLEVLGLLTPLTRHPPERLADVKPVGAGALKRRTPARGDLRVVCGDATYVALILH